MIHVHYIGIIRSADELQKISFKMDANLEKLLQNDGSFQDLN